MTYTETRTLSADSLRALCIQHNWYTCGNSKEYEALFNSLYDEDGCPVNLTTEKLAKIADNINAHSEISDYTITSVMYALNRACQVVFDEDDDPLSESPAYWQQTTTRRDGRQTTRIINEARLARHLAQVSFLRQAGEEIKLSMEHDRMYHVTAYVITRPHKDGNAVVTNRFEKI